jgi:signal transduction histidine kinase
MVLLAAALAAVTGRSATAPSSNELGRPFVRHYTPGEHLRGIGSRRVTQDAAGFVYFANDTQVLSFDGLRWDLVELPTESAGVRQFTTAEDGTIFLAGAGVIGFLRGAGAEARFVSLAGHLPPEARNIDELLCAVALGRAVYFSDAEKILIWRDDHFTVIPYPSPPEAHGSRLHRVGNTIHVTALGRGLGRIAGATVEMVSDDSWWRENKIIALEAGERGGLVGLTSENGFFKASADGHVASWETEMNRWLEGKRVYCGRRLDDGSWVVGFSAASGDGGMRFAPDGRYVGPLDTSIGLVVKTVRDFYQDREGGLWLGMDQGAARLEWPSPVSVFDSFNGLGQGSVTDVMRHEGVLYAATSEGFFRLAPADGTGRAARFERINNLSRIPVELRRDRAGEVVEPDSTEAAKLRQNLPHFVKATIGAVSRVREERSVAGSVFWVCGAAGLARFEDTGPFIAPPAFSTRLSATNVREGEELPTQHPPLTFSFVAPRQRPTSPVMYRTRLVGLENEWSALSAKRQLNYLRLPPGDYTFEVRATDAAGVESAPAMMAFTVLAPWWRSWWAIAGYVVAGGGLISGIVHLRTRALRQRASRLEAIVQERTDELTRRNAELVRLHQLELDEKISARLAEDKARLEVLRYQLNPHFLFNTLASISASLPAGGSTARTMVERLAEFCRLTLHRADERDWTTVGDEVRLLLAYLAIEQTRWGDLLDVAIVNDPGLEHERLPHFLLLPLVENALKYGRATSVDRVGLRLGVRRDADGWLVCEVANTGEWIEPSAKKRVSSLGIGLENLRERLARHFPRSHELSIAPREGWVTVTLRLRPAS